MPMRDLTITKATALSHLDATLHYGDYTLGTMAPAHITILSVTHVRQKRAFGLVLAGNMGTRGEAALWGKFTYNEATLTYLTSSLDSTLKRTGDSLTLLQKSLDSLAEVAFNNHRALDYLLASQGGVCAIINKTCYIYINVTGEVSVQEIYGQGKQV